MRGRAGALLTLSYLGAVRTLPNYNVMGLAKASLEANVRFLAMQPRPERHPGQRDLGRADRNARRRRGVKGIRQMIAHVGATPPLRRNVTIDDVGNAAAFLCSDLAAGITGQVIYVDAGFNIVGMAFPTDNDESRAPAADASDRDLAQHVGGSPQAPRAAPSIAPARCTSAVSARRLLAQRPRRNP